MPFGFNLSYNLGYDFTFVPQREIIERLEEDEYTSNEEFEFHLRYKGDAPPIPEGELEVKVAFLSEIAEKAISLIGERVAQGRCNMLCWRVAAKAKKALADVRACADIDIRPHASRLREDFETLKSKSGDVVREVERELKELRDYRWKRKLVVFTGICIILPLFLDDMLPTNGQTIGGEWRERNYLKLAWRVLPYLGGMWWNVFNDAAKEDKKELDEIKITARWLDQVAALVFKVLDEEIVPTAADPAAEAGPSDPAGPSTPAAGASPSTHAASAGPSTSAAGADMV